MHQTSLVQVSGSTEVNSSSSSSSSSIAVHKCPMNDVFGDEGVQDG
jgi:hypothetical protein